MTYRILVTGSREFTDYATVRDAIRAAAAASGHDARDIVIVHGNHREGGDLLAQRAALELGFEVEPHPADWQAYGTAAGPIRNSGMVASEPDLCLAFFCWDAENKGTNDCASKAEAADVPTVRITR